MSVIVAEAFRRSYERVCVIVTEAFHRSDEKMRVIVDIVFRRSDRSMCGNIDGADKSDDGDRSRAHDQDHSYVGP